MLKEVGMATRPAVVVAGQVAMLTSPLKLKETLFRQVSCEPFSTHMLMVSKKENGPARMLGRFLNKPSARADKFKMSNVSRMKPSDMPAGRGS